MFYSINITMNITKLSIEFQYFIESFSLKNKQMCQSEEKKKYDIDTDVCENANH